MQESAYTNRQQNKTKRHTHDLFAHFVSKRHFQGHNKKAHKTCPRLNYVNILAYQAYEAFNLRRSPLVRRAAHTYHTWFDLQLMPLLDVLPAP